MSKKKRVEFWLDDATAKRIEDLQKRGGVHASTSAIIRMSIVQLLNDGDKALEDGTFLEWWNGLPIPF